MYDVLQACDNRYVLHIQYEHEMDIKDTQQLHERFSYNKHVVFNLKLWYQKHVYLFLLVNMMLSYV